MSEEVNKIKVGIEFDTSKLKKGINDAETAVSGAVTELKELESTADDASESTEDFGNTTGNAVKKVNDLETSSRSAAKAVSESGEAIKEAGDDIDDMSEKTSTSKELFGQLNSILGVFGVGFSVTAVVAELQKFIDQVNEAKKATETDLQTIRFSAGDLSEQDKQLYYEMVKTTPYESSAVSTAIGYAATMYNNVDEQDRINIINESLAAAKITGEDLGQILQSTYMAFGKWGVAVEDYDESLNYLVRTSQDAGISLSQLTTILSDTDEFGMKAGMNLKEMADFIARAGSDIDDFAGVGSRFESQYYKQISDQKKLLLESDPNMPEDVAREQAQKYVDSMFNELMISAKSETNKAKASELWAELFGIEVGKISNMLADVSIAGMGGTGSERSTASRERALQGETLTEYVKLYVTPADLEQQTKNYETIERATNGLADYEADMLKNYVETQQQYGTGIAKLDDVTTRVGDIADNVPELIKLVPIVGSMTTGVTNVLPEILTAITDLTKAVADLSKPAYITTSEGQKTANGNASSLTTS